MLNIVLGEKTYTVPYVSALALREIRKPILVLDAATKAEHPDTYEKDLDTLVDWFCLLFGRQFTREEIYASYPADRLMHDIILAVQAVQRGISEALRDFPTKAAPRDGAPQSEPASPASGT